MDTINPTSSPTATPAPGPKMDTHSYSGWLNSDSFIKRALAIFGYNLVVNLVVGTIVGIIFAILSIVFVGAISHNMKSGDADSMKKMIRDNQNMMDDGNYMMEAMPTNNLPVR